MAAADPYDPCPCGSGQKFKFCCYKLAKRNTESIFDYPNGGFPRLQGDKSPPENSAPSTKRKMSEMISEMAAGFLWVGDTIDERQSRLNAACSAWNLACGSPDVRRHQLDRFKESYQRFNPTISSPDLANFVKDMETLIERKLKLFPEDKRQIVSATVVKIGETFRIEVASATLQ